MYNIITVEDSPERAERPGMFGRGPSFYCDLPLQIALARSGRAGRELGGLELCKLGAIWG